MRRLLLLVIAMVSNGFVFAQNLDGKEDREKEILQYKKSSDDFIYSEEVDSASAFTKLVEEVVEYSKYVSDCETSPDKIKENAILIEYFDYEDEKNYFYYIAKKSLLKNNSIVKTESLSANNALNENMGSVLESIILCKDYFSLKSFIDKKQEEGVVQYRQLKEGYDDTRFCYWIIFDNSAKIIAVLDKSCKIDLLSNRPISKSDYQSNKKMWVQIY